MAVTASDLTTLFPELDVTGAEELLARVDAQPTAVFADLLATTSGLELLTQDAPYQGHATHATAPVLDILEVDERPVPFVGAMRRLTVDALQDVYDALRRHPLVDDAETLVRELAFQILSDVHEESVRLFCADLHAASAAGRLAGETPEARYSSYQALSTTSAYLREFAERYQLGTRLIRLTARRRADHTITLLADLAADAYDLHFFGRQAGDAIGSLDIGAGDTHAGGRSVALVTFTSGLRLVYKPRDLSVDFGVQDVLSLVNDLAGTNLPTLTMLHRGDHGWVEFVSAAVPATQVARLEYFRRVGQLLGVFYVLGATDMHHGNLICDGVSPIAIDLETALHPDLRRGEPGRARDAQDVADRCAHRVGLLPMVVTNGGRGSFDVGGVGFDGAAVSPYKSLTVKNRGRDDMHVVLENQPLENTQGGATAPVVPTGTSEVYAVSEALRAGFAQTYRAMAAHRDRVDRALVHAFGEARIRYIHNPTSTYCQILRMVGLPWFSDLDRRLAGLQRIGLAKPEVDPALAQSEVAQLAAGDVPLFTARTTSTVVDDAAGNPIADVLECSVLDAARATLAALDEDDLRRQDRLIAASFVGKFPTSADFSHTRVDPAPGRSVDRAAALELVVDLADDLVAGLLPGVTAADAPTWVGPLISTTEDNAWQPGRIGYDFYAGSSGKALFLAYAGDITGKPAYTDAATRIFEGIARQFGSDALQEQLATGVLGTGLYGGVSGLVYALAHGADLLERLDWRAACAAVLPRLHDAVTSDYRIDLIGGNAGALAASLAVHRGAHSSEEATAGLSLAAHAIDALIAVHPVMGGRATQDQPGFSGFAHGTAGIYPFVREYGHRARTAGQAVPEQVWTFAGALADHVASTYDESERDWWITDSRDNHSTGWCHGAPGIALAHVMSAEHGYLARPEAERDLDRAAEIILERGIGANLSYCHGDAGNLEILTRIADVLDDRRLRRRADAINAHFLADVAPRIVHDERNKYSHTASLLVGTTGVGYHALRTLEPDTVPSVLSLD